MYNKYRDIMDRIFREEESELESLIDEKIEVELESFFQDSPFVDDLAVESIEEFFALYDEELKDCARDHLVESGVEYLKAQFNF